MRADYLLRCQSAAREALREAALEALPQQYYEREFDPLGAELAALPPAFTDDQLETVVEARTLVLEVLSLEPLKRNAHKTCLGPRHIRSVYKHGMKLATKPLLQPGQAKPS